MIRIGIPRALLYYTYFPLWRAYFTEIGAEVVVSPRTNKQILDTGLGSALDEACLPVKTYFGHTVSLAKMVDYLFIPRLISVEPQAFICPKFMGLPDMIRARIPGLPPLIDLAVDFSRGSQNWQSAMLPAGRLLTGDRSLIRQAYRSAEAAQLLFQQQLEAEAIASEVLDDRFEEPVPDRNGVTPPESGSLSIGLLGHPYNIYDDYISMNLIRRLQAMGVQVVTADAVPPRAIAEQTGKLPKQLFWTLGRRMVGAAFAFYDSRRFDGVIYLSSFGCGPESLIGELIARWARRRSGMPFMLLTIDEHSGAAGLITRLEAFIDMLRRRKKHEDYIPAYGQSVHCGQGIAIQAGGRADPAAPHIQENR